MASTIIYYKKYRKALMKELGGACFICGSRKKLQFHHLINGHDTHGIGGWQMYYRLRREVRENPREIILLCFRCHKNIHGGGWWRE